jgi:hypothetical protein
MNWYKKAQTNFSTWLAEQINILTDNYQHSINASFSRDPEAFQKNLNMIQMWAGENNPDLSRYTLASAYIEAKRYQYNKTHMSEQEQYQANKKGFMSEHQNISPQAPNFAVDMSAKQLALSTSQKNRINKGIHALITNKYFDKIPLQDIVDICLANGVVVLQEDGEIFKGFLIGGAECGSPEAEKQYAEFELATRKEDNTHQIAKNLLLLRWCKMPSGRYEILCHVS